MARKAFPLRINEEVFEGLRKWAADDLRSVNAQIEFLLAKALKQAGRDRRRKSDSISSHEDQDH